MSLQQSYQKSIVVAVIAYIAAIGFLLLSLEADIPEASQQNYTLFAYFLPAVGTLFLYLAFYLWKGGKRIRTDSRSIAILAIFAAMVLALEIFPIPFLTDIPLFGGFTLDPTGIPICFVFLAYGNVFSFLLLPIMWIAIGYRNIIGSVFKLFAEFFTLLGLVVAKFVLRGRSYDWKVATPIYLIFGVVFRAIGMYIANIYLIQWLYGLPLDVAIALSVSFVIPNIIQAAINVLAGILLFVIIPENLAIEARFGKYGTDEYSEYQEIPPDELESINDE
ncbi:MAG: hypothetical protein EAX87_03550 [Candidatus Thorarchaeota archaeon]|nr:hypothetical protein [Candidatus Thorarchaeota archaeon]